MFLTDSCGQKYKIEVVKHPDDTFHWELKHKRDFVGLIKWTMIRANIMEINELVIRDDSDEEDQNIIERIMKEQVRPKYITKNYRKKGLGTKLLKSLVDYAGKNNVKQICGSIIKTDLIRTPNLIEWYQHRGFRTGVPYTGCIKNAITWIYFDLASPSVD